MLGAAIFRIRDQRLADQDAQRLLRARLANRPLLTGLANRTNRLHALSDAWALLGGSSGIQLFQSILGASVARPVYLMPLIMIIVSYATDDGVYGAFLERLRESCDRANLKHDLRLIAPTTRLLACLQKPAFIREMLGKHGRPVMWLDADALGTKYIELPSDGWDIGLIANTTWSNRKTNPMSSFVITAAPTDAARGFIEVWEYLCAKPDLSKRADHRRLTWTREMKAGTYREIDLRKSIRKAVIRDFGRPKQAAV